MPTRLLFLLDDFPAPTSGGTEAQFWLLYRVLEQAKWCPRVVTLRESEYLRRALPAAQYECLDVHRIGSVRTLWRAWKFCRRARREGFGVAHLYLNDVSALFPPLLRMSGIRVIVSRRDLGFWYTSGLLRLLRVNRFFVDRVVANCEAVKRAVCQAEGFRADRVEVILNGYERPAGRGVEFDWPDAPAQAANALVLGMVANLRPLKRVGDAIRALARLSPDGAGARLIVAGEDRPDGGRSAMRVLRELAEELGVSERVHFVGNLSDTWAFLDGIDVLLSCSDTEGLSNSIIEAMACAKPVIGTAVGGTPELIDDGVTGLLYPARDVPALAHAIDRLITNPELRRSFGVAAKLRAERDLGSRTLAERHEHLYAKLAGELSCAHTATIPGAAP